VHFSIDAQQQPDGRWTAQVPEFPQIVAFADTQEEAIAKAELRALIALAEKRFRQLRAG
jgi:predicted RNase H-like HicB family nuclease